MAATTITKDGEIPGFPAAPRQEREVVSLSEIRLNLKQVFIIITAVAAFLIGIGLGLERLNTIEDRINSVEKSTNERFDKVDNHFQKIETILQDMQKDIHQLSLDVGQLKQQMVDTKGKR